MQVAEAVLCEAGLSVSWNNRMKSGRRGESTNCCTTMSVIATEASIMKSLHDASYVFHCTAYPLSISRAQQALVQCSMDLLDVRPIPSSTREERQTMERDNLTMMTLNHRHVPFPVSMLRRQAKPCKGIDAPEIQIGHLPQFWSRKRPCSYPYELDSPRRNPICFAAPHC